MSDDKKNNVISFEQYTVDSESFEDALDVFQYMTEDDIELILEQLDSFFMIDVPANDDSDTGINYDEYLYLSEETFGNWADDEE